MKILFICGSIEPSKDGVGDYTRRLCGELIKMGHHAQILSLFDKQALKFSNQNQLTEENLVLAYRIPKNTTYSQRLNITKEIIEKEKPDLISLQYVPFSFHNKGVPFWLPFFLKQINHEIKWHVMFHEMWTGISKISPFKHKVYGFFQRQIAKKIITNLEPISTTTSNILYQLVLEKKGISAEILPLFSNIPKVKVDEEFKKIFFEKLKILEKNAENYLFTGVFGSIYPEANLEIVLNELIIKANSINKKIVFISFGRNNSEGEKKIKSLKNKFSNNIQFFNYGILSEYNISNLLQLLNIGISCTPYQHLGKSGVFAAMKLHNLEVIMSCNEELPEYTYKEKMQDFINRPAEMWSTEYVARNFISAINKHNN